MGAKVVIEHISEGWIDIFKSAGMQAVVDEAGERIRANAGDHFRYEQAQHNQFTAAGFVGADDIEGAYEEAEDKVLTKAVHR